MNHKFWTRDRVNDHQFWVWWSLFWLTWCLGWATYEIVRGKWLWTVFFLVLAALNAVLLKWRLTQWRVS